MVIAVTATSAGSLAGEIDSMSMTTEVSMIRRGGRVSATRCRRLVGMGVEIASEAREVDRRGIVEHRDGGLGAD